MAKEIAFGNRLRLATTYRILNTLIDQGLMTKDSRRRYVLGRGAAILADGVLHARLLSPTTIGCV